MLRFSLLVFFVQFFFMATCCLAAETANRLDSIKDDSVETQKVVKKESGFVPVPIPIGDPTVGYGLGVALLYLHPQRGNDTISPTSTTGLAGMYTETHSYFVALFQNSYWSADKYRFRWGLGYGQFNLDFYGTGTDSPLRDNPIGYSIEGWVFTPRFLVRIPLDNWFLGAQYVYLGSDITFDLSNLVPGLHTIQGQVDNAGIGGVVTYDSRDDNFSPAKGTWFELVASHYGEAVGGDFEYQKLKSFYSHYFPILDNTTLALRLDGQFSGGDVPFFDLPYLRLRPFPAGLYRAEHAVSIQLEGRWKFHERWGAVLFGGLGRIADEVGDLGSSPTVSSGGVGLRYQVKKGQGLKVGLDIAVGEGESAVYIQVGEWF
jgi:hypothetical protein